MPKIPKGIVPVYPSPSMTGAGPSLLSGLAGLGGLIGGQGAMPPAAPPGLIPNGAGPSLTAAPQVTGGPSAGDAAPPPGDSGNFFRTQNQDGTADYLGGLVHYDPRQDQTDGINGLSKFGAMLEDVGSHLGGGGKGDSLNALIASQRATRLQQQLMAAVQTGDPQAIQQAALAMAAMSGDPDKLISASRMNRATYEHFNPDDNVVQLDAQGKPTGLLQRGEAKPQVAGGMQYIPGQGWTAIPHYQDQQEAIARAQAEGRASGTPAKPAAGMGLPKTIGQPWLRYQKGN